MAGGAEDKPYRVLAIKRIEEYEGLANDALVKASTFQRLHYGIGAPAAMVGAIGTVSFFVREFPLAASWVALVGGILTALAAFLGANRLAELHFRRHECLKELVQRMENAVAGGREPTREELDRFAVEWRRCTLVRWESERRSSR